MKDLPKNIRAAFSECGIPEHYAESCCLPYQQEATDLVSVGKDIYDRERQLTPEAAMQWSKMLSAAEKDGVQLQLVSAFRSIEYQVGILKHKREQGQEFEEIFCVSAPPGFSEHHTGRAVDISTPDCEPLTEAFEKTPAFKWLKQHAGNFGFTMSYPRDNCFGVIYEPWHWAYSPDK